jgi:hypothetical protein
VKRIRYNTIFRYKIKPYIYIDPGKDLKWLWREKEKTSCLEQKKPSPETSWKGYFCTLNSAIPSCL